MASPQSYPLKNDFDVNSHPPLLKRTSTFRRLGINQRIIEEERNNRYNSIQPRQTVSEYRNSLQRARTMDETKNLFKSSSTHVPPNTPIKIQDSASSLNGGKKKTHTYKNKDYVVRTGEKGGRYILVGGKEKKKVYV